MFQYLIKNSPSQSFSKALLMLHGYGSNEVDLFNLVSYFPDDLLIIAARAPYRLDFGGYAWYDLHIDLQGNKISNNIQAEETLQKLSKFIDYLIEKYDIDEKNFYLLGFSQGAILSYALALNYPKKIKNIIALSGYINEEIIPLQENINSYNHLNFFISHGKYDEVIPIEIARKIPFYLQEKKIKYIYKEYEMGHEISNACIQDMLNWLAEKK